jgi:hypothetical protein
MHACTDQADAVVCSGACLFWSRGMKKPPEFGGFSQGRTKDGGTVRTGCLQFRVRVFQIKKTKTTINPAAISIQYWPSTPRNAKRLMRNCTVPVPKFWAD